MISAEEPPEGVRIERHVGGINIHLSIMESRLVRLLNVVFSDVGIFFLQAFSFLLIPLLWVLALHGLGILFAGILPTTAFFMKLIGVFGMVGAACVGIYWPDFVRKQFEGILSRRGRQTWQILRHAIVLPSGRRFARIDLVRVNRDPRLVLEIAGEVPVRIAPQASPVVRSWLTRRLQQAITDYKPGDEQEVPAALKAMQARQKVML